MCGIVGVIGGAGRVSRAQLLEMRDTMAHRGPDQAGFWQSPSANAMLGSRRLAILDLSPSGHQPMEDASSGLTIVFNGEIYNYLELAAELSSAGFRFRSKTDTEVLLKSYEYWGERCLDRLNGMFAFAIWDEKRRELFAARDRFGEKPFYYFHDAHTQTFAFASEIKSLVASRLFTPRPSTQAVCKFLSGAAIDAGFATMFVNVFALPAAHSLKYSAATSWLKVDRYWDLDPAREIRLTSDQQYADRFLELLSDAVRLRLRSDVPVGSSLSGGLDSSTIVGLIAKSQPQSGQETFSARFSEPAFDEGPHIERMTSFARVRNHAVYPDARNLPAEIEKLTWHQDAPFGSSSIYAQWCVMRLARERGVTVLLDGQGADEILAGYHIYFAAYFRALLARFELPAAVAALVRYAARHGAQHLPIISLGLLSPRLRDSAKDRLRPIALDPSFAQSCRNLSPARITAAEFRDPLHRSLYETLTETSLPQLLRYADRNSMAFSREVRLPFLDHRLVEFLFAIPAAQKIGGAVTKRVLRNATRGVIPEEIRLRSDKIGFAPPERLWLRGPLRGFAEDIFASGSFRQRDWIDSAALDRLWRRFKNGDNALQGVVWRWLSLDTWARTCLSMLPAQAEPLRVPPPAALSAAASSLNSPSATHPN